MLSVHTGAALAAIPREELAPASVRASVPWRWLVAAAVVALLGALPSLVEAPAHLTNVIVSFVRSAPLLAKSATRLLSTDGAPWLTVVTALVLLAVGFALTRALPALASRRVES
jgi:hypothetical protein